MGSYNWNWPILLKEPYLGWIVSGFGKTILIAVLAFPAVLVGSGIANPDRGLGGDAGGPGAVLPVAA